MSDTLLGATEYSLAYRLEQDLNKISKAYIAHPDFDWDEKPDKTERALPFAAVRFIEANDSPAFVDESATIETAMTFGVIIAAATHTDLMTEIGDAQHVLRNSKATASGVSFWVEDYPGIPLVDKADSNREVGVLEMNFELGVEPFQAPGETHWNNLKHAAELLITLTPIHKDITKFLL